MRGAYRGEFKASGRGAIFAARKTGFVRRVGTITIDVMLLALIAMRVVEVLFFFGLIGSAIVVAITFFEDWKELFGKE